MYFTRFFKGLTGEDPMEDEENVRTLTVAKDGSGDFDTINAALNAISADDGTPVKIFIKKGIYRERLEIRTPFLTLEGEDPLETVITYDHYALMKMEDGSKRGTFRSYSVFIDTHDLTARNLTFENSAGPGDLVGQAVAVYVDGDRIIFDDCRFLARQDTLFTGPLPPQEIEKNGFVGPKQFAERINGRHYYHHCFIRGDIDFIFGSATAFFEDCEIFSEDNGKKINGYVTAASTPEGQRYGYVFDHCRFTGNCPDESVYLGRPWRDYARAVIINSEIGAHILREGWDDWGKIRAHDTVFYAEYGNSGKGADMTYRPSWVKHLDEEDVKEYTSEKVLSGDDGWNPCTVLL